MAGPRDRKPAAAAAQGHSHGGADRPGPKYQPPRRASAEGCAHDNSVQKRNPRSLNGETSPAAPPRPADRTYAALDLGTNTCRLLVARPTRRGFRVVDAFSRIIRLGEGLSGAGRLSEPAMARTVDALKVCRDKIAYQGVQRSRIIATEACRIAANADEFTARVHDQTGLCLEIVSRETEARLAVCGCASLLDGGCEGALVFDIGGGSSEIIWLDLKPERRRGPLEVQQCIAAWTSLQIGVVTLAEKFGGVDVTPDIFEAMVAEVRKELEGFDSEHGLGERIFGRNVHMLGTSGTVTTIAGVHLDLPRYERARVDGCWLSADEVVAVTERLLAMNYDERVASPCIGTERADLVLAGCAILEAIRRQWPCARLRVADRGLREGILCELMAEDGIVARPPRRRRRRKSKARPQPAAGG
ncbi:MAG: Ppx/GppA phosphatase family protein [Hyphomicrobiales bacterium]|nr:Ppx/GppA phosphatase family protein [Hyphomicrobiales bacterium]